MPAPATTADLFELIRKSQLLGDAQLDELAQHSNAEAPDAVVKQLQADGLLTAFQAEQLLKGRHKGFVLGKYRLLDRIGMGGMGQVYLAEHANMKRRVALKVLPPDRGKSEFARERFLRESRAAAALEHPNLVRAYDVEMDGDVAFLVMEYIDGVTLHDLVARRGRLDPGRAAHYLWQIANGLEAIHAFSLVHRDIKPANVLLDRAGIVRILDLGLVRSELDDDALTRGEGAKIVGTADYLAPEQAIECSKVTSSADLYSLGCTAYYLLTGQPPFPSDKVSQKLIAHQTKAPPPLRDLVPNVPAGMAAVVEQLLAKKPADRPASATEVLNALGPFVRATIPAPDDFPSPGTTSIAKNGISLNGWVSMNMVAKGPAASASGSAIRFAADTNPKISPSQANQQTATNSTQETLPPAPAVVPAAPPPSAPPTPVVPLTPAPNVFRMAESSKPAAKPRKKKEPEPAPPPIVLELPKPKPPQPALAERGASTTFRADSLFRQRPPEPTPAGGKTTHLLAIALGCLLAFAAAVGLYVLGVKP